MEDNYYRKVKDIAAETLKKVATEGQHENIPKEVRRVSLSLSDFWVLYLIY